MNRSSDSKENGSVLVIALMTITIVSMICATSIYIASQNAYTGMQVAGWQQTLTGAESGIDAAVRALNAYVSPPPNTSPAAAWANWYTVNSALPTPSPGLAIAGLTYEPTATATPATVPPADANHYVFLPSANLTVNVPNAGGEGANKVATWVTIDTAGMQASQDAHNQQWYRVRSTSRTVYPSGSSLLRRISNNRLDSDLRNTLALNFSRKGGTSLGPTRTVEVVLKPLMSTSIWGAGILLQNALQMSGGGVIDHFNSATTNTATFLSSPSTYRSTFYNEMLVGMLNANGSDLKNTYVYGQVAYSTSSAAPKDTTNIQGSPKLTTPFTSGMPVISDPSWSSGQYLGYTGGNNPPFSDTSSFNKAFIKINGDLNVPGGKSIHFAAGKDASNNPITAYTVWITGKYNTSGSGYITQDSGVSVTWYVDNSITTSGGSYINTDGYAGNVTFIGVAPNSPNSTQNNATTVTVSGGGSFVGTIEAPAYDVTISGGGNLTGGIIANTLNISGGASFHYDDALDNGVGGTNAVIGNYAFASWFEDNANPTHKDSRGNYIVY
jgi:hypothetical protein